MGKVYIFWILYLYPTWINHWISESKSGLKIKLAEGKPDGNIGGQLSKFPEFWILPQNRSITFPQGLECQQIRFIWLYLTYGHIKTWFGPIPTSHWLILGTFQRLGGSKIAIFWVKLDKKFDFKPKLHQEDGFQTWVKYIYSESFTYILHESTIGLVRANPVWK